MLPLQPLAQGCDQLLGDALRLDPAHIKGVLMREGVVVEQLHRDGRRQLLRRLEQTHQQDRPQELINHPLADLQLAEEGQRIHGVVAPEHRLTAVEIEHRHQQSGDAEPIGHRQPLEVVDRGEGLPQRTGQLRPIAEHRCCGLQSLRRPERTAGELGEHLLEAELRCERVDVGVVLPEAAGAGLKRFAAGGGQRRAAGGIGHAIEQGDTHSRLTKGFGGSPTRPAGTNHHRMGCPRRIGFGAVWHQLRRAQKLGESWPPSDQLESAGEAGAQSHPRTQPDWRAQTWPSRDVG